jgi:hypothetical protein
MATDAAAGLARGGPSLRMPASAPVSGQPVMGGGASSLSSVSEGIFLFAVGAQRCVKAAMPAVNGPDPACASRLSDCPPPFRILGSSGACLKLNIAGQTRNQLAPPGIAQIFAERPTPV